MAGDENNGRVTIAILSTKLDNVLTKLDEYHKDAEENAASLRVDAKEREERLRILENEVSRIHERQGILALLQAGFSATGAIIAGWFGART